MKAAIVSVAEQIIEASKFTSKTDKRPKPWRGSIGGLIGDAHTISEEKDGEAWSPAVYAPGKTRGADNVDVVTGFAIDLDDILPAQLEAVLGKLDKLAYVRHSTFQHDPNATGLSRVRIFLPATRPMAKDEYTTIRPLITMALGAIDDSQARDISRISYLPRCPASRAVSAGICYHDGTLLNVDRALAEASLPGRIIHYRNSKRSGGSQLPIRRNGTRDHLGYLGTLCNALGAILGKLGQNQHLNHRERFRVTQIAISMGMGDQQICDLFKDRPDFKPGITLYQIQSLRENHRKPACVGMAADFGFCDGNCFAALRAGCRSPVGLVLWDREAPPWVA